MEKEYQELRREYEEYSFKTYTPMDFELWLTTQLINSRKLVVGNNILPDVINF